MASPEYQQELDSVSRTSVETRQAIAHFDDIFCPQSEEAWDLALANNQEQLNAVAAIRQQADKDWDELQGRRNQIFTERSIARRKGRIALEGFDVT